MLYLRSPLNRLSNVLIIWQVGLTSFNKLISIYNLPRENRRIQNPLKKLSSEIRLDSVSYLNDDYSVSRIGDLIIKSNSITQIFSEDKKIIDGLFNILQKKIEIVEGNVYFDEISIHELSEFEVRKNTTIISHDVPLLGATLIKAVSYNNQEKNKVKLLKIGRAHV